MKLFYKDRLFFPESSLMVVDGAEVLSKHDDIVRIRAYMCVKTTGDDITFEFLFENLNQYRGFMSLLWTDHSAIVDIDAVYEKSKEVFP